MILEPELLFYSTAFSASKSMFPVLTSQTVKCKHQGIKLKGGSSPILDKFLGISVRCNFTQIRKVLFLHWIRQPERSSQETVLCEPDIDSKRKSLTTNYILIMQ